MFFFSLPEVVYLEVMSKWSDLNAIGMLDSAVCNKCFRESFLYGLLSNTFLGINAVKPAVNNCMIKWIGARRIKVKSLEFFDPMFVDEFDNIDASEIQTISVMCTGFNFVDILNASHKLNELKLENPEVFLTALLERIDENILNNLNHIFVSDYFNVLSQTISKDLLQLQFFDLI